MRSFQCSRAGVACAAGSTARACAAASGCAARARRAERGELGRQVAQRSRAGARPSRSIDRPAGMTSSRHAALLALRMLLERMSADDHRPALERLAPRRVPGAVVEIAQRPSRKRVIGGSPFEPVGGAPRAPGLVPHGVHLERRTPPAGRDWTSLPLVRRTFIDSVGSAPKLRARRAVRPSHGASGTHAPGQDEDCRRARPAGERRDVEPTSRSPWSCGIVRVTSVARLDGPAVAAQGADARRPSVEPRPPARQRDRRHRVVGRRASLLPTVRARRRVRQRAPMASILASRSLRATRSGPASSIARLLVS